MSNSTTQSNRQHRSRQTLIAFRADLPGRYPNESGWNTCSTRTDRCPATTVCATLSATVGTPRTLVPPPPLGIGTALTSGGKYVPDDIRFQTLYKLFLRSFSNTSSDTPSTPDEPLFPLTFTQASHTSRLEMLNGLAEAFNSSIPLLPENFRLTEQTSYERPSPFAPPRLPRLPHYYEPVRQRATQRYSAPDRSASAPGSPCRPDR
jgi:hypothetical protein